MLSPGLEIINLLCNTIHLKFDVLCKKLKNSVFFNIRYNLKLNYYRNPK